MKKATKGKVKKFAATKDQEVMLQKLLVENDVPEKEIARLGGPNGFLSNFLSGLSSGKYPLLTKLIQSLITVGISGLSGSGTGTVAKGPKASKDMEDDCDDDGDDD